MAAKFKVNRRVRGIFDGDPAKGKAPSVHEPGETVTVENHDDARIESLVKSAVLSLIENSNASGKQSKSKQPQTSDKKPSQIDHAALPNMSLEDLRKHAAEDFKIDSVEGLNKDELLALIAEAIAAGK